MSMGAKTQKLTIPYLKILKIINEMKLKNMKNFSDFKNEISNLEMKNNVARNSQTGCFLKLNVKIQLSKNFLK